MSSSSCRPAGSVANELAGLRSRVRLEGREPCRVCGPLRGQRIAESAVDVARGAGFERAGAVRVGSE